MSEPIGYPPVLPPPAPARGPATWIAPLALVISLLAAIAAGWALLKPAPAADGGNPAVADPTGQICSAFFLVSNGVALQTRLNVGTDPSAQQAIAANARLAMSSGADYLRTKLASNTPAELAEPIATFADQLQTGVDVAVRLGCSMARSQAAQGLSERFDRRQRIIDLMA